MKITIEFDKKTVDNIKKGLDSFLFGIAGGFIIVLPLIFLWIYEDKFFICLSIALNYIFWTMLFEGLSISKKLKTAEGLLKEKKKKKAK